jgi:pullulanase/glycogen debranching enzyme
LEEEHTEVEQKIQMSLIWIKENSYYSSKESMGYIKDITETENTIKIEAVMKGVKVYQ